MSYIHHKTEKNSLIPNMYITEYHLRCRLNQIAFLLSISLCSNLKEALYFLFIVIVIVKIVNQIYMPQFLFIIFIYFLHYKHWSLVVSETEQNNRTSPFLPWMS
jgi:hypothetical protein